jgi:putative FmdB family regulatory protein
MPLYPYFCSCGYEDTVLQGMNDPVPKCPNCKKKLKRKWDGATVTPRFVGGGFHKTDYPSLGGSKGNPVITKRSRLKKTAPLNAGTLNDPLR